MIPYNVITAWGVSHPWPTREQIEQDLLLAQAICEISNDPLLGTELVLRGGTAFHKLFLETPYRYSEDLDYVRTTEGGIGDVMKRLTEIGKNLGYTVKTKMSMYPKVYWRTISQTDLPVRIKIEINTYERSPALPYFSKELAVNTEWYSAKAVVRTFQPEELVATKIRAIYQRSKGRDLFDIWLALTELALDTDLILKGFEPYRPDGYSSRLAINNLEDKLNDTTFRDDISNLIIAHAENYDVDVAGNMLINNLLKHID
jgi:predicted nucleotidyltransferase component of viral defense system